MLRVLRFLRGYLRYPLRELAEEEVTLSYRGEAIHATTIRPSTPGRLPGWILLHGVTVPGRHHPVLMRFAHAVAASGAAVVVPEVGAWRKLRLDSQAGDRSISAAVQHLRQRDDVDGPLRLMGFSFGATQALMSAAKEGIREHVRGVVAFGGYCDLARTLKCMITGEHEWQGIQRRIEPDPYGRWIVVANYIDSVPEYAHMRELRRAAYDLAVEAGRRGVYAAEATYDAYKRELRERLSSDEQEVWDLIAPPAGAQLAVEPGRELAAKLTGAAQRESPDLDPRPWLPRLDQRIVLAHGYDDRLIPYTETLRLHAEMPRSAQVSLSLTRLFSHSREAERLRFLEYPREVSRYFFLLRRALEPADSVLTQENAASTP